MAKTQRELNQERTRLLERIATQRAVLARDLAPLQRLDRAGHTLTNLTVQLRGYVRQNPLSLALVLGGLLALRPRSMVRWARRGWMVWRGWRLVQQWQPGLWLGLLRRFL